MRLKKLSMVKMVCKIAENEKPNLILLNVNLPDITGYEVCEQLKLNPITEDIPIISMSSYKKKKIGFTDWNVELMNIS